MFNKLTQSLKKFLQEDKTGIAVTEAKDMLKTGVIPANYVPHDSEVERARVARGVVALLSISGIYFLYFVVLWILGYPSPWLSLVFTLTTASLLLGRFLKIVPNYQAFITNDILFKDVVVYGPGLHFSFPWEEAHRDGNHSLKTVTKTFTATIATAGDELIVKCVLRFSPFLHNLRKYASQAPSTIEDAILASSLASLSEKGAAQHSENFRKQIVSLGTSISKEMRPVFPIEYGILYIEFVVEDMDFSSDVQKARSAKTKAQTLKDVADELAKIEDPQLRKQAMATTRDIEYKVIDATNIGSAALTELASGESKPKEV